MTLLALSQIVASLPAHLDIHPGHSPHHPSYGHRVVLEVTHPIPLQLRSVTKVMPEPASMTLGKDLWQRTLMMGMIRRRRTRNKTHIEYIPREYIRVHRSLDTSVIEFHADYCSSQSTGTIIPASQRNVCAMVGTCFLRESFSFMVASSPSRTAHFVSPPLAMIASWPTTLYMFEIILMPIAVLAEVRLFWKMKNELYFITTTIDLTVLRCMTVSYCIQYSSTDLDCIMFQ